MTRRKRRGTGSIQTPAELRQRPGGATDATGIDRGSAGALPATTGVKPGHCPPVSAGGVTLSPGLNRGTTGDNRAYAWTLPAFTGALPATTGALPRLHRDKP
ncbi:hypothetical protein DPMN_092555 [Dreissena polymorpha]|uniref:Uncharacterized protein n=1 Tax=Dreissena polymorpha TaxID=45954 RepID=A0A9D4L2K0_DREPO|nr:hypothetical protein DPMN_092555 [Dreissena polymorpha]